VPIGPLKSLCYGTIAGDSCVIICIICRCSFLSINIIQTELGFQQNPISAFTVCDTEETLWAAVIILQHSNLKPWCFHMISTLQMHFVLSPFLEKTNGDHFSSYRDTSIWEPLKSLDLLSIGLANRSQHLAGIWAGCNVIIGSIAWFFWSIFDTPKLEHVGYGMLWLTLILCFYLCCCHLLMVNVTIYSIHGSYGYSKTSKSRAPPRFFGWSLHHSLRTESSDRPSWQIDPDGSRLRSNIPRRWTWNQSETLDL
jgi:hypothetical protein